MPFNDDQQSGKFLSPSKCTKFYLIILHTYHNSTMLIHFDPDIFQTQILKTYALYQDACKENTISMS